MCWVSLNQCEVFDKIYVIVNKERLFRCFADIYLFNKYDRNMQTVSISYFLSLLFPALSRISRSEQETLQQTENIQTRKIFVHKIKGNNHNKVSMIWLLIEISKLLMLFKPGRGVNMIFKCICIDRWLCEKTNEVVNLGYFPVTLFIYSRVLLWSNPGDLNSHRIDYYQ